MVTTKEFFVRTQIKNIHMTRNTQFPGRKIRKVSTHSIHSANMSMCQGTLMVSMEHRAEPASGPSLLETQGQDQQKMTGAFRVVNVMGKEQGRDN